MLVPLVCAQGIKKADCIIRNQYFVGALLFELIFFVPLGTYLYFFHPDWSLMYFYDPSTLSESSRIMLGLIAIATYIGSLVVGFVLSALLVRKDREGTAIRILAVVGIALLVFSAFTIRQLTQVGTFAEWNMAPRLTTELYLHRVGIIVGIDSTVATLALAAMLRSFARADDAAG